MSSMLYVQIVSLAFIASLMMVVLNLAVSYFYTKYILPKLMDDSFSLFDEVEDDIDDRFEQNLHILQNVD